MHPRCDACRPVPATSSCATAAQEALRCAAHKQGQAAAEATLQRERHQEAARQLTASRQAVQELQDRLVAERERGADLAHELAGLRRVFEEAGLLHAAADGPNVGADGMRSLKRELVALQCGSRGDCRGCKRPRLGVDEHTPAGAITGACHAVLKSHEGRSRVGEHVQRARSTTRSMLACTVGDQDLSLCLGVHGSLFADCVLKGLPNARFSLAARPEVCAWWWGHGEVDRRRSGDAGRCGGSSRVAYGGRRPQPCCAAATRCG